MLSKRSSILNFERKFGFDNVDTAEVTNSIGTLSDTNIGIILTWLPDMSTLSSSRQPQQVRDFDNTISNRGITEDSLRKPRGEESIHRGTTKNSVLRTP